MEIRVCYGQSMEIEAEDRTNYKHLFPKIGPKAQDLGF